MILFSGSLFKDSFKVKGTAIVNFANLFSCSLGMGLLYIAGRKTLMLILQIILVAGLIGMWFFTAQVDNQSILLVVTLVFIFAF